VLATIIEHRRQAAQGANTSDDIAAIRAAFALLLNALDPASLASGQHPPAAGQAPARPERLAPASARAEPAPGALRFDDIWEAFAELRNGLGLPADSTLAGSAAAPPSSAAGQLLDHAAAEAQACASWYRDTPEWQRITRISRAGGELISAIRDAAGECWAEIRQDTRVRGFTRTVAARVCLAISGTARLLADGLAQAGYRNTRVWQAASALQSATRTFASTIIRYPPPGAPERINDTQRIIDSLHGRQPGTAEPLRSSGHRPARGANPVTLASTSFPVPASQATAEQSAPARRATSPRHHQRPAHLP
jgi:hypothetical protein